MASEALRLEQEQRTVVKQRLRVEQLEDRRVLTALTVNTELDVVDANDGLTSLREAAAIANATVGDDVIEFHHSLAGKTISLNNTQIIFSDSVTITGLGSGLLTIDAHNDSRIFNFTPTALNVTVSGLTLHRGVTTANNFDPDSDTTFSGGALRFAAWGQLTLNDVVTSESSTYGSHTRGGGIYVAGSLTMISSAVIGCTTNSHNGDGGGLWVGGTATLDDSIIQGNTAGGVNSDGGGISANGVVTITNSLIADNSSVDDGAGVWSYSNVFVIGSTISGNSTTKPYTFGGGVGSQRNVTVISSTITGNSSFDQGGGIWAYDDATIINSTVSGNSTSLEISEGGGIWADRDLIIEFCTITDNTSNGNGGGIRGGRRSTAITSSIVAGNTSVLGTHDIFRMSPYLFPVLYSLIGDNAGTSLVESQKTNSNGSRIGNSAGGGAIDPKLGPLADNGGGVLTHALLPNSPAIDAGMPIPVGPPQGDVRGVGFDRIRDGNGDLDVRADMGAFEVQTPFVASADFTGDGVVDGADFLAWQRGFGMNGTALPINGDANGDLVVDGADLAFWCETFESSEEEEDLGGGIAMSLAASSNGDFTADDAPHELWHDEFDAALEELAIGMALKAPPADLRMTPTFFTPIPESLLAQDDDWNGSGAQEQTLLSEQADEYAASSHGSPASEGELPKAAEAGAFGDEFEADLNDGPEADQVGFDALASLALSAGAL